MAYPFDMTFDLNAVGNAEGLYGNYQIPQNVGHQVQQAKMNALIAPMAIQDNSNLLQPNNGAAMAMSQPQTAQILQLQKGFFGHKLDEGKEDAKQALKQYLTGGTTGTGIGGSSITSSFTNGFGNIN